MNQAQIHVAKIKYFEWYARNLWNIHRRAVREKLTERCSKCAISALHTPLVGGVCSTCRNESVSGESIEREDKPEIVGQLEDELRTHQGKGSGCFDALLPVSGGKDSAYLLCKLRTEFPELRVLGVTVDTGFLSPTAVENTLYLVGQFNVDHIFFKPDPNLFITGFRYALTHLGSKGCYGNVDRFDGDLVHDIARHIAAAHKIPLILSGVSRKQVEIIFGIHQFEMPRERELVARQDTGGLLLSQMYEKQDLKHWWNPEHYDIDDIARVVFPLYAWNFSEDEIRQKVISLGLIRAGKDSPLVTNNLLLPLMGFVDVASLGYSSFEGEFADMIREGKADYTQWRNIFEMTEYSAKTGWLVRKEVLAMLEKLALAPEDVGLNALGRSQE